MLDSTNWIIPLITLTLMEIVLGIDNIIFIAIVAGRLPQHQQHRARQLGLAAALVTRLLLLFVLTFILGLQHVIAFTLPIAGLDPKVVEISWRDVILIVGGLFLIAKSVYEIHDKLEGAEEKPLLGKGASFGGTLVQIALLDIVFSLDSVITAVGMAKQLWVMIVAMVIAVGIMLFAAGPISNFVHKHPTLKMLALSFLILIGVMLLAEGFEQHINRGYIYFAMAFAVTVEMLNLRLRAGAKAVELHEPPPVK
ncbi:MAG: TerC family protein [Planctomycetes bacterium]|nr:TerC family protein [Planctomycetota bacterium]